MTNCGLHIEVALLKLFMNSSYTLQYFEDRQQHRVLLYKAMLNCETVGSSDLPAIYLLTEDDETFCRVRAIDHHSKADMNLDDLFDIKSDNGDFKYNGHDEEGQFVNITAQANKRFIYIKEIPELQRTRHDFIKIFRINAISEYKDR